MGDNESHTKRAVGRPWQYRRCSDTRRGRLVGESQIVELISLGAPLPGILNTLCTSIDSQIGDIVSLVFLPDEQEHNLFSITQLARQFGLNNFSSTRIFSTEKSLLGTFQIYCCEQRRPNLHEAGLIRRVIRSAGAAFQRHEDAKDSTKNYRRLRSETGCKTTEKSPFVN
jgi:AraC-like DNA-binding protein